MNKVPINPSGAPRPLGPYSPALLADNLLFVSGQIPLDPATGQMITGDIREQTRQVMENIHGLLMEAKMDFSHVVKTSIFLADMNDFALVNEVYASYFVADFPARETVQVARLPKDARIEISVLAMKG